MKTPERLYLCNNHQHNQGINARDNEQGINKSMYYSLYNTMWNKVLVKTKMHVQFYCDAYLQLATSKLFTSYHVHCCLILTVHMQFSLLNEGNSRAILREKVTTYLRLRRVLFKSRTY